MEFVPLLVMSALVKKIVDLLKYGMNGDVNAVITQLTAWLAGVLVTLAAAQSDFGASIVVNGTNLGMLNVWSQALIGLNLASAAGLGWDVIKAVDASNSAVVPNLLGTAPVKQGVPGAPGPVEPEPHL